MLPLLKLQRQVRAAVLSGDFSPSTPLAGGHHPDRRLAIHTRHYEASLVKALLARFPGTVWLVGSSFVIEAARHFVRLHPPTRPCIAEYGDEFPGFLETCPGVDAVPYLRAFAELEFGLGEVSLEIEIASQWPSDLAHLGERELLDAALHLQPGVRYVAATWPVDELLSLYLADSAPTEFSLSPHNIWCEVRGSRGDVRFDRLSEGSFLFRSLVAAGSVLGEAAEQALAVDSSFDPGSALADLFGAGLVTGVISTQTRSSSWPS